MSLKSDNNAVIQQARKRKGRISYHVKRNDIKKFWKTYSQCAKDLCISRPQLYNNFSHGGYQYIASEYVSLRISRMSNGLIPTKAFWKTPIGSENHKNGACVSEQ